MYKIENSPEYEANMKRFGARMKRKARTAARILAEARDQWAKAGMGWLKMSECPLAGLEQTYGIDGVILVSDGKETAIVGVSERFGRPVFWKKEPEQTLRDGMIWLEGGEEDPRHDLPKWWWKYELKDQLETTYAYGETYHGREIDFVPTIWTFLPTPPKEAS